MRAVAAATAWLAILVSLGGCVSIDADHLATGMKVVRIGCTLALDRGTTCYKVAGDICGRRGFALYDWDGTPWPLPYPDPLSLSDDDPLNLLVACRS